MAESATSSAHGDGPDPAAIGRARDPVFAERVRLLYANLAVSQAIALAIGLVLAFVSFSVVDGMRVAGWLGALIVTSFARIGLGVRFRRSAPPVDELPRWSAWFSIGAAISALVWGSSALVLYPPDSTPHQTFIAFALGGMVAGSMTVLTPVYFVFALFSAAALAPIIVRFVAEANPIHYAMAAMCAIFLTAMLMIGRRIHLTIDQTLRLRFENRALITRLTEEKAQVESINKTLMKAQEELQRSNEALETRVGERTAALEALDRRKDEFLAVLSHELRNPLAPIRNSIYILGKVDPTGPQAVHAREVIERQTQQIARLVDDLLDVTRIARGKIALQREPVDLTDLVTRTVEDHRMIFRRLDVGLVTELPRQPVYASVDRTRVAQVIGNLLQNAAKFTPLGGMARVMLRTVDEDAELQVTDTGMGIAPEFLPVIFEPFAQSDRSLARTTGGLGLGLALVKEIVGMHGGTVQAESEGPDRGSRFIVRLPLHAPPEPPASGLERLARGDGAGRRVLVVDDNHDAADSLAMLVRMFGHTADVAYDGNSALDMARARPPDVVLCDVGLPDVSGYELARTLRNARPDLVLIAVSGYAQPGDVEAAGRAGFNGHLAKPPSPDAIKRLLE